MSKRLALVFALCASLGLAGCDDKDAQQYAQQLSDSLDAYQAQVNRKVSAEKNSYKELAAAYERARQRNIESSLEEERVERSEKLAAEMLDADHLPRNTQILDSLRSYADEDFGATRDFLQVEADAQAQFLGDIEALEFESENIDDLKESLAELAKPKGRLKRLRDATVFAQEAKEELDKLNCHDLAARLAALEATVATLKLQRDDLAKSPGNADKIKALTEEIDAVQAKVGAVKSDMKGKC
jgi:hypothetical protein